LAPNRPDRRIGTSWTERPR